MRQSVWFSRGHLIIAAAAQQLGFLAFDPRALYPEPAFTHPLVLYSLHNHNRQKWNRRPITTQAKLLLVSLIGSLRLSSNSNLTKAPSSLLHPITHTAMERQRRKQGVRGAAVLLGLLLTTTNAAISRSPPSLPPAAAATCTRPTPSSSSSSSSSTSTSSFLPIKARGGASSSSQGVREILRGEGLSSTLSKAIKREGPTLSLAPVLFLGARDDASRTLLSELFDFAHPPTTGGAHVTIAPFGDAADDEDEEGEERQAIALITTLVSEEEDLSSGAFASAAQDAAAGFALGGDVVWTVPFSDVLRGELRGGMGVLQAALEQYLGFEEKGLIDTEAPAKTLHLVVTDVGEEEGGELGLGKALERHVSAMWRKLIKPAGSAEDEEEEGEEGGLLAPPGWARVLNLNVVYVPSKAYASFEHARVLSSLKSSLDNKLTKTNPFLPASTLQSSISTLSSSSSLRTSSLPKADTVISSFYLDKLVARYAAQFQQDSRQLLEELNTGYDDDFGRTFSELIEKYLSDFHQEVYGHDAGPIHTSLQGLDAGQVSAVVKVKKETLRKALLGLAEEGYVRQLQFLKQMAQEEFRKGISALKYQWELIPGFAKAIKAAKAFFVDKAGKLACARSGGKWKATAEKELRNLTKILETQADDVIERTRASGGFVPTKLRRPIGIQVNWLGANFFHFLRDSSVDPLSVRTDSGVALWQNLGETWASRDGKDQRVSARYRLMYGEEIDPMVMDYLLVSPKGVGLNDKDPRVRFGWNRRVAYELVRNHDDMTFQIPHAKAIKDY